MAPDGFLRDVHLPVHLTRASRFLSAAAWLARDGLWSRKRALAIVTTISILGAIAQGSTIGCVMLFVRVIEREGTDLPFLGHITMRPGVALAALAGALFLLQLFSTLASYGAAVRCRAIGRAYQIQASRRLLRALAAAPMLRMSDPAFSTPQLRQLMVRSPRVMGNVVETMAHSIQPVLYAGMAFGIMLSLDATTSLVIAALLVLCAPAFYAVGWHIQRGAKSFFGTVAKRMTQRTAVYLGAIENTNVHRRSIADTVRRSFEDDPAIDSFYDTYDGISLSGNRTIVVVGILKPFFFVTALFLVGLPALDGNVAWSAITAYILALFSVMNQAQGLAGHLSVVYRFYPPLIEYLEFLGDARRSISTVRALGAPAPPPAITFRDPAGRGEPLVATPGRAIALVTDEPLTRLSLAAQILALDVISDAPTSLWQRAKFVSGRYDGFDGTLLANLCGRADADDTMQKRVEAMLDELGVADEVAALAEGLATVMSAETWADLTPTLQAAVRIVALATEPGPLVLLDIDALKRTPREFIQRALALFADRYLVVVGRPMRFSWPVADRFILLSADGCDGIGDWVWFDERRPALMTTRRRPVTEDFDELEL